MQFMCLSISHVLLAVDWIRWRYHRSATTSHLDVGVYDHWWLLLDKDRSLLLRVQWDCLSGGWSLDGHTLLWKENRLLDQLLPLWCDTHVWSHIRSLILTVTDSGSLLGYRGLLHLRTLVSDIDSPTSLLRWSNITRVHCCNILRFLRLR